MLCRPYFGDQGLSAKYVCSVWKVGLELEGVLERENRKSYKKTSGGN